MKTEEYKRNIIRYLNNQMEPEEKTAFERELDADAELSEAFFTFVSKMNVKHQLDQLVKNHAQKMKLAAHKAKRATLNLFVKVAAVAVIILVPAVFMIQHFIHTPDSLISETNMSYFGNIQRGDEGATNLVEQRAFSLYQKKNYAEAAVLFMSLADSANYSPRDALYSGICLLWSGKKEAAEKAITVFKSLSQTETPYSKVAQWYYGIALYETGEKEEAKLIFNQFANDSSGFKKKEAINILKSNY